MPHNPLDAIQARADKATEGPWFVEGEHDEVWEPRTVYHVFHNGDTMDRDKIADSYGPDSDFIQAAREDVPKLVAALRAVESIPELTDRENGDPEFIDGWGACLEEIKTRIREALG